MKLNNDDFSNIILKTPLIAIDMIIEKDGKYLLGKRNNEPAKGFWFVPGGRIMKDESLPNAFARLTMAEIGKELSIADAEFIGLYEHMYKNNVFNNDFSTHYIVLAHHFMIDFDVLMDSQHEEFKWMTVEEILNDENVHDYTKAYYRK